MTVLKDTFTDANSTTLKTHVPDQGTGWTKGVPSTGDGTIHSNRVHAEDAGTHALACYCLTDEFESADHIVTIKWLSFPQSGAFGGVTARSSLDWQTAYQAFLSKDTGVLVLRKRIGGTNTVLKEVNLYPGGVKDGQTGELALLVHGESIAVEADGVVVIEATDGSIAEGRHGGIFLNRGATELGFHIDEITVTNIAEEGEAPTVVTGSSIPIQTTATVKGSVNPHGQPTTYYFEYVTATQFAIDEWESASTTELKSAGEGSEAQAIDELLSGITDGTPYHYRLIASSEAGESIGAGSTFYTFEKPLRIFLVGGQSNAQGVGNKAESPVPTENTAFEWRSGELAALKDPVDGAEDGSAWPSFCIKYIELTGGQVVILAKPVSGSSQTASGDIGGFGNWDPDETNEHFDKAVTAFSEMLKELESQGFELYLAGVLWSQGEADSKSIDAAESTKGEYKEGLERMIAAFREEYGASLRFFIFRTGRLASGDTTGFEQVRDAQDEVAEADPLTWDVFDGAVFFPDEEKMSPKPGKGEQHYSQPGYNQMGEEGAENVAASEAPKSRSRRRMLV